MKYDVTVREVQKIVYLWNCPECNIEQSSNTKPHNDHYECHRCIEKKNTVENQKRLEELLLCAKVVKIESAKVPKYAERNSADLQKLKGISLLCSDDETLIHIKAPSHEWEDEYEEMSFEIEKLEKSKR
jgi:hypothetical protein